MLRYFMVWDVGKSNNNTHMYVVVEKELQKMELRVGVGGRGFI